MKKSELKKLVKEVIIQENAERSFDAEYKQALKLMSEISSMLVKFVKSYKVTDKNDFSGVNFIRKANEGLRKAWSELKYGGPEKR